MENRYEKFLEDLKTSRTVVVFASSTNCFIKVTKKKVLKLADRKEIHYYITDKIFRVKRKTMVIY